MQAAPRLTRYAGKYGEAVIAAGTGKSALTPLEIVFPPDRVTNESMKESQLRKNIEHFQRQLLWGYTTRDLMNIDAISTRSLKRSNLRNGIHPLFEFWEDDIDPMFTRADLYPIGHGFQGDWVATNPVVWNILKPVLVLATRVLINIHKAPWFAALLVGQRRHVDPSRIPLKDGKPPTRVNELQTFHLGGVADDFTPDEIKEIAEKVFTDMVNENNFQFGFMLATEDPEDCEPMSSTLGLTWHRRHPPGTPRSGMIQIWTFLATKMYAPLLRDDLDDSERMGLQWSCVNTIIHEVMHAVWLHVGAKHGFKGYHEPFFEDEPVEELGASMEHTVFGGLLTRMLGTKFRYDASLAPIPDIGYWLSTNWPTHAGDSVLLKDPPLEDEQIRVPIQVSWFQNVQQESFWEVGVRQYGLDMHHVSTFAMQGSRSAEAWNEWNADGTLRDATIDTITYTPDSYYSLVSKVTELSKLAIMDPVSKRAFEYGSRILTNADMTGQAQINFQTVDAEMESMFDAIKFRSYPKAVPDVVDTSLGQSLTPARRGHEKMIEQLLVFEQLNDTMRSDTRTHLLNWNRRARAFSKGLRANSNDPLIHILLRVEDVALEIARMKLWSPADSRVASPEDYLEWERLEKVYEHLRAGANADALQILSDVRVNPDTSLFAMGAERIFSGWAQTRLETGRTYIRSLEGGVRILMELEDECPAIWMRQIKELKDIAQAVANGLI